MEAIGQTGERHHQPPGRQDLRCATKIHHQLPTPSVPKLHPTSLCIRRLPLNQLQRNLPLGLRVVCQASGIVHRLHGGRGGGGGEWDQCLGWGSTCKLRNSMPACKLRNSVPRQQLRDRDLCGRSGSSLLPSDAPGPGNHPDKNTTAPACGRVWHTWGTLCAVSWRSPRTAGRRRAPRTARAPPPRSGRTLLPPLSTPGCGLPGQPTLAPLPQAAVPAVPVPPAAPAYELALMLPRLLRCAAPLGLLRLLWGSRALPAPAPPAAAWSAAAASPPHRCAEPGRCFTHKHGCGADDCTAIQTHRRLGTAQTIDRYGSPRQ